MSIRRWDIWVTDQTKAVVVEAFGSGTVPSAFAPKIHDTVRRGIPVFLISGVPDTANEARGKRAVGIPKITYGPQAEALEAGAVHLESVNIGHLQRAWRGESKRPKDNVLEMIKGIIAEEGDMFAVIDRVRNVYTFTDNEIRFVEEQTQENAAPITREEILHSRQLLDAMLKRLKEELFTEREAIVDHSKMR